MPASLCPLHTDGCNCLELLEAVAATHSLAQHISDHHVHRIEVYIDLPIIALRCNACDVSTLLNPDEIPVLGWQE